MLFTKDKPNIVPKNICIDTCALISNFLGDEPTCTHLKDTNQFFAYFFRR